jgi:hypothetical protein
LRFRWGQQKKLAGSQVELDIAACVRGQLFNGMAPLTECRELFSAESDVVSLGIQAREERDEQRLAIPD